MGLLKNKKNLIYIAIGVIYIISTPIFSNNFFKLVEGNEYKKSIGLIDSADAIVVLSGILAINEIGDSTYIEWGDPDRFYGGIDLFEAGKAQKLVFTGAKMPWNKNRKTEGVVLKEYAIKYGIPSNNIFVTKDVENTADEAIAVKELLGSNKKIILVTSAYHMYRAKMIFEKQGIKVIAYKVDYQVNRNNQINIIDFMPSAGSLGLVENGIKELLGRLYYLIKD